MWCDTGVSEKNTPPENNRHGHISFQIAKSGAGLQFLPLDCRRARRKGELISQTPVSCNVKQQQDKQLKSVHIRTHSYTCVCMRMHVYVDALTRARIHARTIVTAMLASTHVWYRCVWKQLSFSASLCPATQLQKLQSSPWLGDLKANIPMCIVFRRSVFFVTDTGIISKMSTLAALISWCLCATCASFVLSSKPHADCESKTLESNQWAANNELMRWRAFELMTNPLVTLIEDEVELLKHGSHQ